MKKKLLVIAALLLGANAAHAGWELGLGYHSIEGDLNSAMLTVGGQINDNFAIRTQIAAGGSEGPLDLESAANLQVLIGGNLGKSAWPYVAFGGYHAKFDIDAFGLSGSGSLSGASAGAGVKFALGEHWKLDNALNRFFEDEDLDLDLDTYSIAFVYAF